MQFKQQNPNNVRSSNLYPPSVRFGWFTLAEAKEVLKNSEYNNNKSGSLKNALVRSLNTSCLPQKWYGQQKYTNVFWGFKIVAPRKFVHDHNGLD